MKDDIIVQLQHEILDLRARVDALESASGLFASAQDLDGPKGDPAVKLDPRDWRGVRCKGRRLSECPPEFLDEYAKMLMYFAENPKPDKTKYAAYDRADAARCRSWARRLRSGWVAPKSDIPEFPGDPIGADVPEFDAPGFGDPSADDFGF
jgi:hypothetical protein